MTPNQRRPREKFSDYKERCARLSFLSRPGQRQHQLIWNSSTNGTYIRAKHGALRRGGQ